MTSPSNSAPAGTAPARAAQRERLVLLCAVDRARLRLLLRMPTRPKSEPSSFSFASGLFSPPTLAALLPWIPGRIGRWSRRVRTGAHLAGLFRTVMRAAT